MKQAKAAELGWTLAAHPPARRRDPGRRASRRSATFNDDPHVDAHPRAAPDAAADRLRGRAARDRPRQGRRRAAPGEPGPARPVDAGPGAVHARGDRGAARVLRDPGGRPRGVHPRARHHARPAARAAAVAEAPDRERGGHRGAHRRARLAAVHAAGRDRGRRGRRARHPPARAHHARARSWSAAASATRAASSCPTSTSAARRSRAAITPRVGGVGPTTIAMLFRNAGRGRRAASRAGEREARAEPARRSGRGATLPAVRHPGRPELHALPGVRRRPRPASATAPVPTRRAALWWTVARLRRGLRCSSWPSSAATR